MVYVNKYDILLLDKAREFVKSLPKKVRVKIYYNLERVKARETNDTIFKKLDGHNLWEIRTRYFGNTYRLLCFFDKFTGGLVVATHGFMKKTQQTPSQEIALAEQIMKDYYIDNYPKK